MKEKEIIEGNKLIAEFMGYKLITPEMRKEPETWTHSYWQKDYPQRQDVLCEEKYLNYNASWDWIIPICIKCREIAKEYEDYSIEASTYNNIKFHLLTLNLENVWYKVIEFIKVYNQNKKV